MASCKFAVALIAVLAVFVDVGLCRLAGEESLSQLRGSRALGPGIVENSALKVTSPESGGDNPGRNKGDTHGYKDVNNDHSNSDDVYEPQTQDSSASAEHNSDNDDTNSAKHFLNKDFNSLAEEHRNRRSADRNASHIAPDKFITAGRPTGLGQYPWVVHLNVKGNTCGGSLVSWTHVITAAHCLDFQIKYYEEVRIYLAEHNTRTYPTDCVGRHCIQNYMVHPDKISIHQQYRSGIWRNDIAMMRLKSPAPNTGYIHPIPLPTFNINDPRYEGTPLTITGWGKTEYGQPSSIKLHAKVQLVAPNTCRRYHPVTKGMLCAASRNGQDMCYGDSGGPIMVKQGEDFHLVGLVSFRISKCGSSVPSMYTNVYSYLNWIQDFMRN